MKIASLVASRTLVIASALLLQGLLPQSEASAAPPVDVILEWNNVALEAMKQDFSDPMNSPEQGGPTRGSRALAIVHAAMFDAFNSIDGAFEPYLIRVPGAKGASTDAAVAQAARDTLAALYTRQTATFDQALQTTLSRTTGLKRIQGQLVGKVAAAAILANRTNDGSQVDMTDYVPGDQPGQWRPDPINPTQTALSPHWGSVKPFVIKNVDDFPLPPPPALDSAEYAAAFNQVKDYGKLDSPSRTDEQTIIGIFWGYDGTPGLGVPPRLYNQVARVIAAQKRNTPRENARLFALINFAMADAGITAWNDKYLYEFWRPVTAVREADEGTGPSGLGDGNPDTAGDVAWEPLGAPASNTLNNNFTPPFPAYASGHATFGAALFTTLTQFYGTDNIAFDFTSDEYNGVTTDNQGNVRPVVTRHYNRLSQATFENAISRIYLGVHWEFDATAGVSQGTRVGNYVFSAALRPKKQ